MSKFKVGDKVKLIGTGWGFHVEGTTMTIVEYINEFKAMTDDEVELQLVESFPDDFEVIERLKKEAATPITTLVSETTTRANADDVLATRLPLSAELGVFRPNLEDRKVGKVRVELVDDGFPLALREVAKVMTWAQTAKGYKDHDWQNLPNPEQALAAAASRHRSDYIIQRMVEQLAPTDCVDVESAIIHKAHEAFGVLAQLELILRGKIK